MIHRGHVSQLNRLSVVRVGLLCALDLVQSAQTVLILTDDKEYIEVQSAINDWIAKIEEKQFNLMAEIENALGHQPPNHVEDK